MEAAFLLGLVVGTGICITCFAVWYGCERALERFDS
jgi:hypothetical protein